MSWLAAIPLIGYGINQISKALSPNRPGMLDPRKYKDELTLSDSDIAAIRSGAVSRVQRSTMPLRSDVKQFGAARRLPAGAVYSGLKGVSYEGARGISEIEPEMVGLKLGSNRNYYDLLNQYTMAEEMARRENRLFSPEDIGELTRIVMLWKAGLLEPGEMGQMTGNNSLKGQMVPYGGTGIS